MTRAIIFDVDGTLSETEETHRKAEFFAVMSENHPQKFAEHFANYVQQLKATDCV